MQLLTGVPGRLGGRVRLRDGICNRLAPYACEPARVENGMRRVGETFAPRAAMYFNVQRFGLRSCRDCAVWMIDSVCEGLARAAAKKKVCEKSSANRGTISDFSIFRQIWIDSARSER
jgi:hypothetical protein